MKRSSISIALSSIALFFVGCAVNQEQEVASYRTVVNLPTTRPLVDASQPVTLIDAMLLANQKNERLSIEGENYLQALINRKRAVASFLPTIDLAPGYIFREQSGQGSGPTNALDVSVVGEINLFNGFSDVATLRASDLTIAQRRALLLDTQESLLADTVRVYFQVLQAEAQVRVLENSLSVQDERVRDIRGRQAAGIARPLDVAQTEAQASSTKVTLIDARNVARNARSALSFLTGVDMNNRVLRDTFPVPDSKETLPELQERSQKDRQDLQGAQSATLAARQNVDVQVGQYYPSVTLNLEGFLYRETVPDDRMWEGVINANLPIFSAGRIEADVRQAWSQFRQAVLFESLLTRQIVDETEQAYHNLIASGERLAELQIQVRAAQQAFEQADASYKVGLATNLERVAAIDQTLAAQLGLAGEEYSQKIAYLDLLRATGVLREELERRLAASQASTQPGEVEPVNAPSDAFLPATTQASLIDNDSQPALEVETASSEKLSAAPVEMPAARTP